MKGKLTLTKKIEWVMRKDVCKKEILKERGAGVLMPVSSLPSKFGIGTLGQGAYAFVDWLYSAGMKIWQVLPLLPTGYGDSPYQSCAADALNYYFIDFDVLAEEGLLECSDYEDIIWAEDERRVDYGKQFACKIPVLRKAFACFDKTDKNWLSFSEQGKYKDFALFMTLKCKFSYAPWTAWEEPYKNAKSIPESFFEENKQEIEFWQFTQYIFIKQWNALRKYANERGIFIMGDMPIYLAEDSVENWKYRDEMFMLDGEGNLALLAGVPPDAFSEDGQFWGNPIYNWAKMKENGYAWWNARIQNAFDTQFDIIRIDHFRAFDRFFAIPSNAESAKEGEWMDGPKAKLFKNFKNAPIVAEDLGIIDDGVRKLLNETGYPGMKVFEFAFDGDPNNDYLPSNIETENCVVYTGTHDNDTLRSFIENKEKEERRSFETVLEEECLKADVAYVTESLEDECQSIIELLFSLKANTVIIPMHDVLCFGEEARLNEPSTVSGKNWTFRFTDKDFKRRKAAWLKQLTETYKRN